MIGMTCNGTLRPTMQRCVLPRNTDQAESLVWHIQTKAQILPRFLIMWQDAFSSSPKRTEIVYHMQFPKTWFISCGLFYARLRSVQQLDEWIMLIFFSFLRWGESNWHANQYLAYFTRPGWWMMMSVGSVGGMLGRGNRSTRSKPSPVWLCLLQIPHDMTWTRILAAEVRSLQLITWDTAWPLNDTKFELILEGNGILS
jgi:hypothetical protein